MTRETYIKLREENSIEIMFEYYQENFKSEKHSPKLEIGEFIEFMRIWPNNREAFNVSVDYYDSKFNVLKCHLENKTLFI